MSFLKQLPPKPGPELRNLLPRLWALRWYTRLIGYGSWWTAHILAAIYDKESSKRWV